MNWDLYDFVAAFVLIGGALAAIFVVTKLTTNRLLRIVGSLGLVLLLALVWVELAVGIIA